MAKATKGVNEMTGPELIALYNKLSDKPVKKFANRIAGIVRVSALLAEKDSKPEKTKAKAKAKGASDKKLTPPKKSGTVGFTHAKAMKNGTTKLQVNTLRSQVFDLLTKDGGEVQLEKIESGLGFPCRGHVLKLLERGHVQIFTRS